MKRGLMLAAAAGAIAQGGAEARAQPEDQGPPGAATPPAGAAAASGGGGSGLIAYPAGFFAEARPTNAYDMVLRLPGFAFNGGDGDVRGFAGAVGNVLIDGERPSAKSVTLEALLRRIPAAAVDRIELIRGGAPGIDMQGQPMVANVVRARTVSSTTAVTLGARGFPDGWIGPQADLEWARRGGGLSLEGALHATWEMDPESGKGRQTLRSAAGTLLQTGPLAHRERGYTLQANGTAELRREAQVLKLSAGVEGGDESGRDLVAFNDAGDRLLGRRLVLERRIDRSLELGGDYERTFSESLSGRLVVLGARSRQTVEESSEEEGGIETSDGVDKTAESIVRASLTTRRSDALTVEAGAEGALNVLDSRTAIAEDGTPLALPNANVRVEERRAEAFVTAQWKISQRLTLEGGGRAEVSRISQSGDSSLARSFFFPKPRAILTYVPDPSSLVRLKVERQVGQLDFEDFAAAAEFTAGTVIVGNPNLAPERSWLLEAAFERRFWDRGSLGLTLSHAEVGQAADLIPVAGRFDAPGNIGHARRDQVRLTGTLPLDRLGIKGGLLTGEATWRRSAVKDPVTGLSRRIAFERPLDGQVRFSQDLDRLSSTWGIDGEFGYSETQYRIDEIRRVEYQTYWTVYFDWKPNPGLSVRTEVQNVGSRDFRRIRTLYPGPRSQVGPEAIERRNTRFDPYLFFRVRKLI